MHTILKIVNHPFERVCGQNYAFLPKTYNCVRPALHVDQNILKHYFAPKVLFGPKKIWDLY